MSMPPPMPTSPHQTIMQMINGKCVSRCISVIAELAIADHLADGPKDASKLAEATATNSDALYRVLRMLAALGVFVELPDRRFQNSPLSEVLRSDSPGSVRHYARWFGRALHWHLWTELNYSLQTGEPSICKSHPNQAPFEILAQNPLDQETFNDAMGALSAMDGPAILRAFDFTPFGRIVDVGGGDGTLASLIASAAPGASVTVFDLAQVIQSHTAPSGTQTSATQVNYVAGSLFARIPGPTDLCVLKHILHDWQDEDALRILRNCRDALSPNGRVLVCEMLIEPGWQGIAASILDIEMLVGVGGRERTAQEFSDLFAAAGLRLERVVRTPNPMALLEALAVN